MKSSSVFFNSSAYLFELFNDMQFSQEFCYPDDHFFKRVSFIIAIIIMVITNMFTRAPNMEIQNIWDNVQRRKLLL